MMLLIKLISIFSRHKRSFESRSGEVYSIQHYVIKFVSDLRQVGDFLRVLTPVSSTNKIERHDITEILLKVALNTITLALGISNLCWFCLSV